MSATVNGEASSFARWDTASVPVIAGLSDTRKRSGQPYAVRRLGDVFRAEVCKLPKESAPAFLPSLYAASDARAHEAQRERGQFVALVGDIDKGDHSRERITALVESFTDGAAWLVYSTASARPSERRWRVVVPLHQPVSFNIWYDAQLALSEYMAAAGVVMDTSASRPGQVAFLPNVPDEMRDDDDQPLFFQRACSNLDLPGLGLVRGPVADGIRAVERKRAQDDAERERIRREAEQRRRSSPLGSADESVIDTFNQANPIQNLLAYYEYQQSPRDGRDWRSPNQTSGTYATRILDGSKWISLSGSDAAAGVGARCSSGCYGDAFDLFLHYEHGGDRKAAWRAACEQQGRAHCTSRQATGVACVFWV